MAAKTKKEEKIIPAAGPGSKICALPPLIRQHIKANFPIEPKKETKTEDKKDITSSRSQTSTSNSNSAKGKKDTMPNSMKRVHLNWSTIGMKNLPIEIYKNEEISNFANTLEADNNKMKKITPLVSELASLTSINISFNDISRLPGTISKLKNLVTLNVSRNELKTIPNTIHKATRLVKLDASFNKIRKIPPKITASSNLEWLDLRNNQIKNVKKFVYKAAIILNLSHNKLSSLPSVTPKDGRSILELDVSYNELDELPQSLPLLHNLRVLNLSHNALQELPQEFGSIPYLQKCNLSFNLLTEIPNLVTLQHSLYEFNVSYNSLVNLDANFGNFTNLRILNMSNNEIRNLPDTLCHTCHKTIVHMNLSNNKLSQLSWILSLDNTLPVESEEPANEPTKESEMGEDSNSGTVQMEQTVVNNLLQKSSITFTQLVELDFSSNRISIIPSIISKCTPNVKILNFSNNKLTEIDPEVGNLLNLKQLLLSNNKISTLPPKFGKKQILQIIDLSFNNFKDFPLECTNIQVIEQLNFSNNKISSLPKKLDELKFLGVLNLESNLISTLTVPRNIQSLNLNNNPIIIVNSEKELKDKNNTSLFGYMNTARVGAKLNDFYISMLNLTEIPAVMFGIIGLMKLDASQNQLTILNPKISKLLNLRYLDLSNNSLSQLPSSMERLQQLEHLNISHNMYDELADVVVKLQNLTYFSCANNSIRTLPPHFGSLYQLTTLDISFNKIENLPVDRIDILASLSSIDISNNLIQQFPSEMPYLYRLSTIKANNNDIMELPTDIGKMMALQQLHLSNNMIEILPESIGKLGTKKGSLDILYIDDNKVTTFPKSFDSLRQKLTTCEFSSQSSYKKRPHLESLKNEPDEALDISNKSPIDLQSGAPIRQGATSAKIKT